MRTATSPAVRGRGSSTRVHTRVDSPLGPLTLVAEDDELVALLMDTPRSLVWLERAGRPDARPFAAACAQLDAYFAGRLRTFDLPLRLRGTPFQLAVWGALLDIPFGRTRSYGELAEQLGRPSAARAVGAANGQNPLAILVPCHRLVGAGGALTGYAGGLERKGWLLDHERRVGAGAGR